MNKKLALLILILVSIVSSPALAQTWLTMDAPHFLITFQEGHEHIAEQAAYFLERSHENLVAQFGHEPLGKTEIVLTDTSDIPNGFATPFWGYNKEQFLLVYGAPNVTLRTGIDTWLYTLAIHEYTHTVHLDMSSGISGTLRKIFGRGGGPDSLLWPLPTIPNITLPQYLIEGFASYLETVNTDGGRLRNSLWEMMMRADFANDQNMSRDQSSGKYSYSRYVGDAPHYMYGAYFCDYLARRYGQDKLFEVMAWNSKGRSLLINGTFKKVYEKSLPELWNEFIEEAKSVYAEQIDEIEAFGLTELNQLSQSGENSRNPVYSPDGQQIAYLHGGKQNLAAIRLINVEGAHDNTAVVVDSINPSMGESFSWSPNGRKIVYSAFDFLGRKLISDLYIYDFDRAQRKRLTYGLRTGGATWSPDGVSILFTTISETLQNSLMIMEADGNNLRPLLEGTGERQFDSPRFSPDGTEVVLGVRNHGGFNDMYLMNSDGSDLRPITQDRAMDHSPTWTPAGDYILFNSDRSGVPNIYAYRINGGQILQVTNVLYGAFSPTVSPDGSKIAFMNYDIAGYDVAEISLDTNNWKQIQADKESLPPIPNYAEFASGFEISAYDPIRTLIPRKWSAIIQPDLFAGLISTQDALGRTTYSLLGGMTSGGKPYYEMSLQQALTEHPGDAASSPTPMTVNFNLDPAKLSGGLSIPIERSINSSRTLRIGGTWGQLGTISSEDGPVLIEGLAANLAYLSSVSGGRDRVRATFSSRFNGFIALTQEGTAFGLSGISGVDLLLNGDLRMSGQVKIDSSDLSMSGFASAGFTLAFIEKQIGTLPIYFERISLTGFVGGSRDLLGNQITYVGGNVSLPTYLWYFMQIEPSIGFVIDSKGDMEITYGIGL
jgi:Tol biopolymer transport system component